MIQNDLGELAESVLVVNENKVNVKNAIIIFQYLKMNDLYKTQKKYNNALNGLYNLT